MDTRISKKKNISPRLVPSDVFSEQGWGPTGIFHGSVHCQAQVCEIPALQPSTMVYAKVEHEKLHFDSDNLHKEKPVLNLWENVCAYDVQTYP